MRGEESGGRGGGKLISPFDGGNSTLGFTEADRKYYDFKIQSNFKFLINLLRVDCTRSPT